MNMHNPAHPGKSIKNDYLAPLGMTTTEFARNLGVSKATVDRIIKGECSITTDMAIRLGKSLSTTPESFLAQQAAYDLWQAQKANKKVYKAVKVVWEG